MGLRREQALERFGELFELDLAVERPPAGRPRRPSRRTRSTVLNASEPRPASTGSTRGRAAHACAAPTALAARSAARTDMPSRAIRRASRRRSSWSGTESTARACPSVSVAVARPARGRPRAARAAGRGSRPSASTCRRDRRPRRAKAETRRSGWRRRAPSSIGERSSRATFSTRPRSSVSRSSASRTTAGTFSSPASRAARQRRSPAISS